MTEKTTPNPFETLTEEQQKAELVKNLKIIFVPIARNLARTGTIYLLGRKFAPEIFSGYGRTYAFVLLIDMLKSRRFITSPPAAVVQTVSVNSLPEKTNPA